MYFVLYDRHLNSIGETYLLESWERVQRAVDFDDLSIVGEQIPYSAEPFFVVINDRQGKQMFSGLASTPVLDEKLLKTKISLKDYLTLLNSEVIVDWSKLSQENLTLNTYINFIFQCWVDQIDVGFSTIVWNTDNLTDILWDSEIILGADTENVQVESLIMDAMNLYAVYCIPELDVYSKTLTYTFYKSSVRKHSIRLKDFGTPVVEKSFGEYNRATVYSHLYQKVDQWALTEDNQIVRLPSQNSRLLYPAKNKNFVAEEPGEDLTPQQAQYNAVYDAVMGLAANRFQENIDLDVQQYHSILGVDSLDFSWDVSVYTEDGMYKDLPVGEIETDSKGKHIVRLGYRIQQLTQEV